MEETLMLTQFGLGQIYHSVQFGQIPVNLVLIFTQGVDILFQHFQVGSVYRLAWAKLNNPKSMPRKRFFWGLLKLAQTDGGI